MFLFRIRFLSFAECCSFAALASARHMMIAVLPTLVGLVLQPMPRREALASAAAAVLTVASPACAKGPKNSVYFTNVKDGDTVPSTFTYKFEVTGYALSPAAAGLKEGTGHHHMIIDAPTAFVKSGEAIPMDATHKHYGKAQSEGELELEPGKHKITLQFANAYHESYGKEFAKTITVNVNGA